MSPWRSQRRLGAAWPGAAWPTAAWPTAARTARGRQLPSRRPDLDASIRTVPDQQPRPRLLAVDIDGTLLDERGLIRPVVRDALAAVSASGVLVVLATGRSPWDSVADLAGELGLDGPQITMQGALIVDPATGTIRRLRALAPDVYRDVLAFADRLGIDPIATLLEGHRAERVAGDFDGFALAGHGPNWFAYTPDLAAFATETPIRLFLPTGPERHWSIRLAAAEAFLGRAAVVWSDQSGIELLAPGTDKGEAVAWFAAGRGISLDEVAAVGDAANDKSMLRVAGRSAAMGTAPVDVREVADVIVRPSTDDGLIDALRWFFPDLAGELGVEPLVAGLRLLS